MILRKTPLKVFSNLKHKSFENSAIQLSLVIDFCNVQTRTAIVVGGFYPFSVSIKQSLTTKLKLSSHLRSFRTFLFLCKWFEPRSISSSYSVIVRIKVVLKRTVVGD